MTEIVLTEYKGRLSRGKGFKRALKANKGQIRVFRLKPKKWKYKKSELEKVDASFSLRIRERDGQCLFPGCERTDQLTCSHYIGRATWSTRFDEDNCITLCRTHHYWDKTIGFEFQKQRKGEKGCDWDGRYTLFMKNRLGEKGFAALMLRSITKISRKDAIISQLSQTVENSLAEKII